MLRCKEDFLWRDSVTDKVESYRYSDSNKKLIENLRKHYKVRLPQSMNKAVDDVCDMLKGDMT